VTATAVVSCGERLVQLLENYGIDTVFGIPGNHTVQLYRGIAGSAIRHISPGTSKVRRLWLMGMPAPVVDPRPAF
jgi:hypothetical protein